MPGGRAWREALEALAPEGERHLLAFEGHVTHLTERDRPLLDHIDVKTMVGDAAADRPAARRGSPTGRLRRDHLHADRARRRPRAAAVRVGASAKPVGEDLW